MIGTFKNNLYRNNGFPAKRVPWFRDGASHQTRPKSFFAESSFGHRLAFQTLSRQRASSWCLARFIGDGDERDAVRIVAQHVLTRGDLVEFHAQKWVNSPGGVHKRAIVIRV